MSPQAATDALAEAAKLPIEIVDTRPFAAAAMTLALRHVGTYYDALYVALAEREDLQVLTADKRMGKAFARLNRTVRLPEILRPSQPAPSPGDKSRSAREPGAPPEDEPDRG